MNCQLAPFNLRAFRRVDLFTKSQDSIEPFALFLLEWGNSKANIFSSKVVHLHCSFRFQWDLTHWSVNQVCPDIYIFETSLASRFRSFNIAPWFQIYFWVQDKAKSCNWPQVDEIGGWEGGEWEVGGWEGWRGGEKRSHIPETHRGLKCPCHALGLKFRASQAMSRLSKACLHICIQTRTGESLNPHSRENRGELERPVGVRGQHPLPHAPLPDQPTHLPVVIRGYFQTFLVQVFLTSTSCKSSPCHRSLSWYLGEKVSSCQLVQWHQCQWEKYQVANHLQKSIKCSITFRKVSSITFPRESLRHQPSPPWSPPLCQTCQSQNFSFVGTKHQYISLLHILHRIIRMLASDFQKSIVCLVALAGQPTSSSVDGASQLSR